MPRPIRTATMVVMAMLVMPAVAQNKPAGLEPLPELPPSALPEVLDPTAVPPRPGDIGYHEDKVNGVSYQQMVTPSTGKPYYLIDNRGDPNRTWLRHGSLDSDLRVPQWLTGKF